jgi:hypothetical protein
MRWCFEHTSTPYSDAILQQMIQGAEAVGPALWLYEVVSVLAKSQRNGSITPEKVNRFLDDLRSFSITVDQDSLDLIFSDVHRLGRTAPCTASARGSPASATRHSTTARLQSEGRCRYRAQMHSSGLRHEPRPPSDSRLMTHDSRLFGVPGLLRGVSGRGPALSPKTGRREGPLHRVRG